MANKALAKRQKLSFRVEPSQKAPRGGAAVRPSLPQPRRTTLAARSQPQGTPRIKDRGEVK